MAFTYGFFNSLNGDRKYTAEQLSSIFDGLITDGVFDSIGDILATVPGSGMQVIVKSGKAWFNRTWSYNDAPMPLTIPAADVTLKRYDAVVLEVNTETATRANSIKIVSGNPGSDPSKPTLTNTEKVHQHALAYILVNAGATSINAGNIENVIGKTECPFVTGLPGPADISDLFEQWEYYFDVWFANLKAQLTDNVAANLQAQIDELKKSAYKTYTGTTLPASSLGSNGDTYVQVLG